MIGKSILFYLCCLVIVLSREAGNPCFCEPLRRVVRESYLALIHRYGIINLRSSTLLISSGAENNLEKRLLRSLREKIPFRVATLGGSYSLSLHYFNAWPFNVTRWLNSVLSTSTCNQQDFISLHDPKASCVTSREADNEYSNCLVHSNFSQAGAVFCRSFAEAEYEAKFHGTKTLDDICDNTMLPHRPCTVFGGSDKFATLAIASKGGTITVDGMWSLESLKDEPVDLLFWDYSMNDLYGSDDHNPFAKGFFERAVQVFPDLAGVGVLTWVDDASKFVERYHFASIMYNIHNIIFM